MNFTPILPILSSAEVNFVHLSSALPGTTPRTLVQPNNIPLELWAHKQFVCWKYTPVPEQPKPAKTPTNPRTLGNAGVGWPNTWTDIRTCVQVYQRQPHLSGIGFVLTTAQTYRMIDLDNCLDGRQLTPFADEVVRRLETYTEISPSGRGLRLFVRCDKPYTLKKPEIEIYSAGRWATLTGDVYADNEIGAVDDLDWLISRFKPSEPVSKPSPTFFSPPDPDDDRLWAALFSRNRVAYALSQGDLSVVNGDNSRGVALLLNAMAGAGCDADRMARLIKQTKLDQTKFDRQCGPQSTWLQHNIKNSISHTRGSK